MIERKYVEYELAKGKKDICIVCNCKNAETLNTFLCSDVRPFEEWIKSDFDKVLSGEIISKEISGSLPIEESVIIFIAGFGNKDMTDWFGCLFSRETILEYPVFPVKSNCLSL